MVSPIFNWLIGFIQSDRGNFEGHKNEDHALLPRARYEIKRKKAITANKRLDNSKTPEVDSSQDKFITICYYMFCDLLIRSWRLKDGDQNDLKVWETRKLNILPGRGLKR